HYVVTENGSRSIRGYLTGQGVALADRMRVVLYDELARMDRLPLGTWVFAEKDRLDDAHLDLAMLVAERLRAAGDAARVLNDPRQVRLRVELLSAAHREGINDHRIFPAAQIRFDTRNGSRNGSRNGQSHAIPADSLRYPVFVRQA